MARLAMPAKRWGLVWPLLVVVLLASAALAQTLTFPTLTGRVVDDAGILDAATRTALTEKLSALEAKTTDQLVVATVKSLQGTSVEDYGNRLFRAWRLGQAGKNNGVLLLVAPNERKVRIEVGYGLEGTLPDAVGKLIIENGIIPRFRANDFAGGITRGVDDVIQVLTSEADAADWKQRAVQRHEPNSPPQNAFVIFLALVVLMIIITKLLNYALPRAARRAGLNWWATPGSGWSSGSSGSSWGGGFSGGGGDSGGFSGGGGDSGGGGSSGSW